MKNILIFGGLLIVGLSAAYFMIDSTTEDKNSRAGTQKEQGVLDTTKESEKSDTQETDSEGSLASTQRRGIPEGENVPELPLGKLKVANFTGKLEKVDTGCFADGECFVEVDGKHITTIMGWSQAVVGSVQGVEGFGDLEGHIGEQVEVYAQDNSNGTYTLYGNAGFYVKLQ